MRRIEIGRDYESCLSIVAKVMTNDEVFYCVIKTFNSLRFAKVYSIQDPSCKYFIAYL